MQLNTSISQKGDQNKVSGGKWLWDAANFRGTTLCYGFSVVTWSQPYTQRSTKRRHHCNLPASRALFAGFLLLLPIFSKFNDNKSKEQLCLERIVQYLALDLAEGQKELAFASCLWRRTKRMQNGGKSGPARSRRQWKLIRISEH